VFYTNADQALNKKEELLVMISNDNPDIIILTEVIPKAQSNPIPLPQLAIPGYNFYVNFDYNATGLGKSGKRGIIVYFSIALTTKQILFSNTLFEEYLLAEAILPNNVSLTIGGIYRSPSANKAESTRLLIDFIQKVCDKQPTHLLLVGDFNYSDINWDDLTVNDSSTAPQPSEEFLEMLSTCTLHQHVSEPTRFKHGVLPTLLDLVITNEEGMISELSYLPPLGKSDHLSLQFFFNLTTPNYSLDCSRFNLNSGDYNNLRSQIQCIDWERMLDMTMDEAWEYFFMEFDTAIKNSVPLLTTKPKYKSIYTNREVLRLRKKKTTLWRVYCNTHCSLDYDRFARVRNELRSLTRTLKRNYEIDLANNIKDNPKAFWKYVNSKLKTKLPVDTLRTSDNREATSNQDKANVLNEYFASVFTQEDLSNVPVFPELFEGPPLTDIRVSEEDVYDKLVNLDISKSPGPDFWHPRFFKEAAFELTKPLTVLFQKSLDTGVLPDVWKTANVVPVFKKGDRKLPSNYRPISLTLVICKILESVIRDKIFEYLLRNNLLSNQQHGFVPGRSCITQLLTALNCWTESLEHGTPVDVIYLDFSKAFDSVPHERLLLKLRAYGIQGNILRWIKSFLSGRKQTVVVNGVKSGTSNVLSGVPQGSVMGPLLFLIYINDIVGVIKSPALLFADDVKIFCPIVNQQSAQQLQLDLLALKEWSEKWLLKFNLTKTVVMHLGNTNQCYTYHMDDQPLEAVSEHKDLGIIIDSNLKFHSQTTAATNKANRVLGLIKKSFNSLNSRTLPLLYKSLVRPHLEYANVVWGPNYIGDSHIVERVQRRATKCVPELSNLEYEDRRAALNLPSLSYRRHRADMLMIYNILHENVGLHPPMFFHQQLSSVTRGHSLKLFKPHAQKTVRCNFFSIRSINAWNQLPNEVVTSNSTVNFKIQLDNYYL